MGQPFFLQFGQFAGKAIEALMFDPHGIEEVERLARSTKTEKNASFLRRLARLLQLGEEPNIMAKCRCGQPATHVFLKRAVDGASFGEFVCADCARIPYPWPEAMALKFSSITRFAVIGDRRSFIGQLKQAVGFRATERMSVEKARAFFYSEALRRDHDLGTNVADSFVPTKPATVKTGRRGPELPFGR